MFNHWDNLYLMIGSGAVALIGLLFVVATLTAGRERSTATRGARVYMTPTVFHFAVVLTISAAALVPELPRSPAGLILAAGALTGLVYSAWVTARLRRDKIDEQHWSDFWWYGVAPTAIYLALAATAASVWLAPSIVPYGTASALLALLLLGIHNAWDLVTWLAPRQET